MESTISTGKIECKHCGCINNSNYKYCRECGYELPRVITETVNENLKKPAKPRKKMSLPQIVGIVVGAIVMVTVQQMFFKPKSFDKAMMQWADEINKSCPVMVDQETRLDNTIALPENTFQYNYTLINTEREDIDTVSFRNALEPSIVNNIRTNPQMKIQRDHKTTLNYYYKDKDGNHILTISVAPDKYK